MSILSGLEIRRQIELGNIEIDPYVPEHVNQHSVDLTLGNEVLQYILRGTVRCFGEHKVYDHGSYLDSKIENDYVRTFLSDGLILEPNQLYLMHTVERVTSKCFVPKIDGKSSIGRLGVIVHFTAGRGDTGFDGQYTLEVMCVYPTRLYPGMRVAQITFETIFGEIEDYKLRGNYVDKRAKGPVASQSWRQFK